ncbi:MAG: hypothetical protein KUG76_05695 [Gammaproteobacteria bacterium]|nr:hypothetical protein [Gammaproteobacteria bacterium]
MKKQQRAPNPVAKHARTFSRSATFMDRKKALKRGSRKHKGKGYPLAA